MTSSVFLLSALLLIPPAEHNSAERNSIDPAFDRIPFDQWVNQPAAPPFHFSAGVSRAQLSFHQRLTAAVEIQIDGKDLDTRRKGELVFFVQVTDSGGVRYQNHGSIDLTKVDENIKRAYVQYGYRAFFLPGDYRLALAILDTATGEHTATQGRFRIALPAGNISTDTWRDLPPVEFIGSLESPDSWFLPDIKGMPHQIAYAHPPARLNVILNIAAALTLPDSRATPSSGLPALLPTLKFVTQTAAPEMAENLEILDLARHRAVYTQEDVHHLDWPKIKASLGDANTASIDVHSLADSHHDAQFFVSQVRRVLRASPEPCALLVLSTSIAFAPGEDLEPISREALPPCQVFYIRYHAYLPVTRMDEQSMGRRSRGPRMGGPMGMNRAMPEAADKLAATLKPLNLKIFDVETPEEMNRILLEIQRRL